MHVSRTDIIDRLGFATQGQAIHLTGAQRPADMALKTASNAAKPALAHMFSGHATREGFVVHTPASFTQAARRPSTNGFPF